MSQLFIDALQQRLNLELPSGRLAVGLNARSRMIDVGFDCRARGIISFGRNLIDDARDPAGEVLRQVQRAYWGRHRALPLDGIEPLLECSNCHHVVEFPRDNVTHDERAQHAEHMAVRWMQHADALLRSR